MLIEFVSLISSCLALIRNAFFPVPGARGWELQVLPGFPDTGLEPTLYPWVPADIPGGIQEGPLCILSLCPLIYDSETMGY